MSETRSGPSEPTPDADSLDPTTALNGLVKDLALGLVLVGIGLFAIYYVNTLEAVFVIAGGLRFYSVPTFCGVLLVVLVSLNLTSIVREMRTIRTAIGPDAFGAAMRGTVSIPQVDREARQRIGTVAALVVYVFLLRYTPFFLATTIFLASMFLLFGRRNLVRVGVVAAAGSAVLTLMFLYGLRLPI